MWPRLNKQRTSRSHSIIPGATVLCLDSNCSYIAYAAFKQQLSTKLGKPKCVKQKGGEARYSASNACESMKRAGSSSPPHSLLPVNRVFPGELGNFSSTASPQLHCRDLMSLIPVNSVPAIVSFVVSNEPQGRLQETKAE